MTDTPPKPRTTKRTAPKPPRPLGREGMRLWREVTKTYELEPPEPMLLLTACELADRIHELEQSIERDGLTVAGSVGQTRLNPAVAEVRQTRLAIARCLAAISWPARDTATTNISERNRQNAIARWRRSG